MISVYINFQLIPYTDVKKLPRSDEKIKFGSSCLMASTLDITLDNTDKSKYDDGVSGSLFYGVSWYNRIVEIYDGNERIWKGRIKNISSNYKNSEIIVSTSNYIKDMSVTPCVYTSSGNVTWAGIVYNLLTLEGYMELDDTFIGKSGFLYAMAIQDAVTAYGNISYTLEDNKNILEVVNEICRMTQCHLYSVEDKLYFYQWEKWTGQTGISISEKQILAGSYTSTYDETNIFNDISIAYDNGGTVDYATDFDPISRDTYGRKGFTVPLENIDSTVSADYKLLFKTLLGAQWAVSQALERCRHIKKVCEMDITDTQTGLLLNEQIDISISDLFINEPIRISERKHDREKRFIHILAELLNFPYEYYQRDITPPDPVELIEVDGFETYMYIKWSKSPESDHSGYLLYFTASVGEWENEFSHLGPSPIDIKNPSMTSDGYCYTTLRMTPETTYYFKIKSYDLSNNKSLDSNILHGVIFASPIRPYRYMCKGSIYEGISLDATNMYGTSAPEGHTKYDEINYDSGLYSITAMYESEVITRDDGIDYIRFYGTGNDGDITLQWRIYNNGVFGDWSEEQNAIGNITLVIGGYTFMQIRFIFRSSYWSDTDNISVLTIVETVL